MVSKSNYYINPCVIQFLILIYSFYIFSVQAECNKVYGTYSIFVGY